MYVFAGDLVELRVAVGPMILGQSGEYLVSGAIVLPYEFQ
jgi:hypothetical protein